MPIDQQLLKDTLREAFGGDGELYAIAEQKLLANEKAATDFMGMFMRNKDYTQKTQALAQERGGIDDQKRIYESQVEQYRQLLEQAETKVQQVMRELAQEKVDKSSAWSRLQSIKRQYNLSDEDIPTFGDVIKTEQKGKIVDSSTDIDEKLAAFEKRITGFLTDRLVPELGGTVRLYGIFNEVNREHERLTGKPLSFKEFNDLLAEADQRARAGRGISYQALWEEKYGVPELRQKHHDGELEKNLRQKWDDEQKAKLSEQALQGIHPAAPDQNGMRTSNILQHKFQVHEEPAAGAPKAREVPSSADRSALTGAERASKRFLERRANGVPMGAPDERKTTNRVA